MIINFVEKRRVKWDVKSVKIINKKTIFIPLMTEYMSYIKTDSLASSLPQTAEYYVSILDILYSVELCNRLIECFRNFSSSNVRQKHINQNNNEMYKKWFTVRNLPEATTTNLDVGMEQKQNQFQSICKFLMGIHNSTYKKLAIMFQFRKSL